MYIRPELAEVYAIEDEIQTLVDAKVNADRVEVKVKELSEQRASISPEEEKRLAQILPKREDLDPVHVINNINDTALQSNFILASVGYAFSDATVQTESGSSIGEVTFTFAIEATYEEFIGFLQALESSEELYDVTVTSLSAPSSDAYKYNVTLKKYFIE
jgi:hypothetical protein